MRYAQIRSMDISNGEGVGVSLFVQGCPFHCKNCFNSYSGDNDEWRFPAIALRDTVIRKNDRICQFEIQKIQPEIEFVEVDHLDDESRGGIGSTGTN